MTHTSPARLGHDRSVSLSPEELLRAAEGYVDVGLSIIPVGVSGRYAKHPHYDALKKTGHCFWDGERGKWVATWLTFRERPPTRDELRQWFIMHRAQGMAMVTGEISGLIALDFDRGAGVRMMCHLGIEPHVRSASGGYHAYVRHPGWHVATTNSNTKRSLPPGLDVRGDGGLIVLPPTVTDVGRYERLPCKKRLDRLAIPKAALVDGRNYGVRELLGLAHPPEAQEKAMRAPTFNQGEARRVNHLWLVERAQTLAQSRGRNEAGFWLACQLRDNRFSPGEALEIGPYWLSLLPGTNTKGAREAYVPAHYEASVRSAYFKVPAGRESKPWVKGYGRG